MKIVAADWLPYCLPFRRPWQSARGLLSERSGALLRLRTADGLSGWGDAAPLPEFGISEAAAREFAEECAQLDLAAQGAGKDLASWLSGEAPVASVAVNAVLGAIFTVDAEQITDAVAAGFSVIKLKVGLQPVANEILQLQSLSRTLPPGVRWRLDANGAWSLAQAQQFISACQDLPVEGLEEPLRAPDHDKLRALQAAAPFPLAIDESLQLIDHHFWQAPPVRRLILKPARCGGLLASIALALQARACGLECIVTSSLESACGLTACAQLAAAIAPQGTHGLATGAWFTHDTGTAPRLTNARLYLPRQNGLGFSNEAPCST